LTIFSSEWLCT